MAAKTGETALRLAKLKREKVDLQRELWKKQEELTLQRLEIQNFNEELKILKRNT